MHDNLNSKTPKNQEIQKQFYAMGYALILNVVIVIIVFIALYFLIQDNKSNPSNTIELVGLIVGIIQLLFSFWYIEWFFVTGSIFGKVETLQESNRPIESYLPDSHYKNRKLPLIFLFILILIIFLYIKLLF